MGISEGEEASLLVPSEPKAAEIDANGEHSLSEPANGVCGEQMLSELASGVCGEQVLSELASGANVEPSPSKPMNDANAKFAALEPVMYANIEPVLSELVNGANVCSAASEMAKMDEGTSALEGEEKVIGGNKKAEDKLEGVLDELRICSTLAKKAKKKQRIKKKKMSGVACKKKVVSPAQKSKKENMKMTQNKEKMETTKKQQEKIKKGIVTADASRREALNGEENVEEQKKKQVEDVVKIETTSNETSNKKRKRGKKKRNSLPGDSGKEVLADDEKAKEQVENVVKIETAPNEKPDKKRKRGKKKRNTVPGDSGKEVLADDEKVKEDELQNDKKVKPNAIDKAKKKQKRINQNTLLEDSDDPTLRNGDKPGAPTSSKATTKGLIFMCNSKTKQDCYRYNVLGLPMNKKNIVAKVYEGMRLFLFDVDLKLLYGIYKAAGPGGYNIEPKAFKSAFPAQVRFHVLHDCMPLPEEKFKAAIKTNYYSKNKFNCQLTTEQVKALCKLFRAATKTSCKRKQRGRDRIIEQDSPAGTYRDRKRSRVHGRVGGHSSNGNRDRSWTKGRAGSPSLDGPGERRPVQGRRRVRSPLLDGDGIYLSHHGMYRRDAYVPHASPLPPSPLPPPYAAPMLPLTTSLPLPSYASTVLPPPLPPTSYASTILPSFPPPSYASTILPSSYASTLAPPPAPSYGYQQASNVDYYRRDLLSELHNQPTDPLPEFHDRRLSNQEPMLRSDVEYPDLRPRAVEYRDSYSMYRDLAPPREPVFHSVLPPGYNPPFYRY